VTGATHWQAEAVDRIHPSESQTMYQNLCTVRFCGHYSENFEKELPPVYFPMAISVQELERQLYLLFSYASGPPQPSLTSKEVPSLLSMALKVCASSGLESLDDIPHDLADIIFADLRYRWRSDFLFSCHNNQTKSIISDIGKTKSYLSFDRPHHEVLRGICSVKVFISAPLPKRCRYEEEMSAMLSDPSLHVLRNLVSSMPKCEEPYRLSFCQHRYAISCLYLLFNAK